MDRSLSAYDPVASAELVRRGTRPPRHPLTGVGVGRIRPRSEVRRPQAV